MPPDGPPVGSSLFAPVQVLEGAGTAATLGDVLAGQWAIAPGTVFFAYDPALSRLAAPVEASLRQSGYAVEAFADLTPEPDLAVAEAVAAAVRRTPCTAVVGLGGGSTLDMAKVAAIAAHNPGPVEGFIGDGRVAQATATLALIPTTAGSGAEASRNAMVSVRGLKRQIRSVRIVPSIAVLDPELTFDLPAPVTAATGLDALSHAVESYISTGASRLTDVAALTAVARVASGLIDSLTHPRDAQARLLMLEAAYFGGLALNAGAVVGHSVAYTIAARTGLSHGVTTGLALPYAVAYNAGELVRSGRLAALGAALTGDRHPSASAVVERLNDLVLAGGLPASLAALGIAQSALPAMVDECLTRFPRPNNPRPFDREGLFALYEHLFAGDPLGLARTTTRAT